MLHLNSFGFTFHRDVICVVFNKRGQKDTAFQITINANIVLYKYCFL